MDIFLDFAISINDMNCNRTTKFECTNRIKTTAYIKDNK